MADVTARFSDRADDYDRARPRYPDAAIDHVRAVAALGPDDVVVDLGAGTGLSTIRFVEAGHRAVLVEPNASMLALARQRFGDRARVVEGRAEATTLEDDSVALVVAAQAFHWFDPEPTAAEIRRILRPGGHVALFWNERRLDDTAFLRAYEAFLVAWGSDYLAVKSTYQSNEAMTVVFGGPPPEPALFENHQRLDREGLRQRILSCSYIPKADAPRYEEMLAGIDAMFEEHAEAGEVTITYDTTVYVAKLSPR